MVRCGFLPGNQQGWPCFSSLPGRSEQAMWSSGAKLKQRDLPWLLVMLVPMFTWSDGSKLQSLQPRDGRSATIVIAYLMWRCATRCIMMNHLNRPKRNCSTHVFNVAACLRLLKRRFSLSFEAAHERIRQKRPICNPNTGGCSRVSPAGLSNSFESQLPVLDFGAYCSW